MLRTSHCRRHVRALPLLLAGLVLALSTGCSAFQGIRQQLAYNERFENFALGWRNYAWSRQAWNEHEPNFCERQHLDDFACGFRDGFSDVADGGTGCTPLMPPRKYWSWQYQTAEGQAKVNAWFAGYPHGVRAAEEYGVGNWSTIQTSGMLDTYYGTPAGPPLGEGLPGEPIPTGVPDPGYGNSSQPLPHDQAMMWPRSIN